MSSILSIGRAVRTVGARFSYRGLTAFIAFVSLTSCGGVVSPMSPETLQSRGLKPGEGYLVGSFQSLSMGERGKSTPSTATGRMWIRGTGPTQGTVAVVESITPAAGPVERFVIPLPAGDYQITEWIMSGHAVAATATISNRAPLKVPVQVKAGEATYLGRVGVISLNGNFLGRQTLHNGTIVITDEFEEDSVAISKAYPSIKRPSIRRSQIPSLYRTDMQRITKEPIPFWY